MALTSNPPSQAGTLAASGSKAVQGLENIGGGGGSEAATTAPASAPNMANLYSTLLTSPDKIMGAFQSPAGQAHFTHVVGNALQNNSGFADFLHGYLNPAPTSNASKT